MVDVATGANYPAVSDAKVKASTIPLPPLAEQKRIAAILDAADALRAKRRESLAGLDTLLQSTFLDMFGDPVTNPMGWDRITFGDLISTGPQNGIYKPSKDYGSGVRILRIDGFYDGAVSDLASLKRVQVSKEEIDTYGLLETDIVINRVNSRSHLGKCALVPALEEPVVFESNMMRLSVDAARMLPRFVTEFFQTQYVKNQILSACKDAVNQSSINQGDVKGLNVLVPPIDVQHRFAVIVESIEQQKASQRAHLDELNTLFASLQSRAFRGDL
jgi:type I restriction enzyme S subunit